MSEVTTTNGNLVTDSANKPGPQYLQSGNTSQFAFVQGKDGGIYTHIIGSPLSNPVTMQNAASSNGPGTSLPTSGYATAVLAISGTFSATVTFQGQGPDGNWYSITGRALGATGNNVFTSTTTSGLFEVNCRGLTAVRTMVTNWSSGTITVTGVCQAVSSGSEVGQSPMLTANAPRLVLSLNQTSFTSTGTKYIRAIGVLSRNARHRTWLAVNQLGVPIAGTIFIYPFDSSISGFPGTNNSATKFNLGGSGLGNNNWAIVTSEDTTNSGLPTAHVDSFEIAVGVTAVPTSGNLYIYVVELF